MKSQLPKWQGTYEAVEDMLKDLIKTVLNDDAEAASYFMVTLQNLQYQYDKSLRKKDD